MRSIARASGQVSRSADVQRSTPSSTTGAEKHSPIATVETAGRRRTARDARLPLAPSDTEGAAMAEDQKPYITRDGKLSTEGRTSADKLLAPHALKSQIGELAREQQMRGRLYPGWIENGRLNEDNAIDQLRQLSRAIESLQLLQEPSINSAITAMKTLTPAEQAVVAAIAATLMDAGTKRPKVLLALRTAAETMS